MRLFIFPIAAPLLFASVLLASCKAEKVQPTDPVKEPSKFELIPGRYKIYDSIGNYLYEMEIKHKKGMNSNGIEIDSFAFFNMDNKYQYTVYQTKLEPPSWPKNFFTVGFFDPIVDSDLKRTYFSDIRSFYRNDTIFMNFEKSNIKYYLSDMVPYYYCNCKQIGVKQH